MLTWNWSRYRSMNSLRCVFGSSSLGETVIVAGGTDMIGHMHKLAEFYNYELDTWKTLLDINVPRKLCSAVSMDGKFHVVGGVTNKSLPLTCDEEYNFETIMEKDQ